MDKKTLRKFDLVFSILLIIGAVFYLFECIKLFFNPFGKTWDSVSATSVKDGITFWYKSPALLPFIVGTLVLICAIVLLNIAIKSGAKFDFFKKEKIIALKNNRELVTFGVVAGMLAIYIYALIPLCRSYLNFFKGSFQGFPFMIATFIYVSSTTIVFSKKTKKNVVMALVVGIIASLVISFLFNKVALIPLP